MRDEVARLNSSCQRHDAGGVPLALDHMFVRLGHGETGPRLHRTWSGDRPNEETHLAVPHFRSTLRPIFHTSQGYLCRRLDQCGYKQNVWYAPFPRRPRSVIPSNPQTYRRPAFYSSMSACPSISSLARMSKFAPDATTGFDLTASRPPRALLSLYIIFFHIRL